MLHCFVWQLEDRDAGRRQMQEKISDLERRLSRDVAATRDVESLRAELQAAQTNINQLQMDDSIVQYTFNFDLSSHTTTVAALNFWLTGSFNRITLG